MVTENLRPHNIKSQSDFSDDQKSGKKKVFNQVLLCFSNDVSVCGCSDYSEKNRYS